MAVLENVDFDNPSKEVIFTLCMGEIRTKNDILNKFGLDHPEEREIISEIDPVTHRDLLAKYNIQSYSDLLIEYQKKWSINKESRLQFQQMIEDTDKLEYKLKISKILRMFLLRDPITRNITASFTDVYEKIDIQNNDMLAHLQETFVKEFERLKLNETICTKEEALEEIKDAEDVDFFIEYGEPEFYNGNVDVEKMPDELIEFYMESHTKPREITIELLERVINELETWVEEKRVGAGAKNKNLHIGALAKRLSYLHTFNSFIVQNQYNSIKQVPLSNKACKFIFDYFSYWNNLLDDDNKLLDDDIINDNIGKGKRANYIRSMIIKSKNLSNNSNSVYLKNFILIQNKHELRIDLFKKVKDGLIPPDEFYDIVNS